jgi:hypothetical protein
MPSALFKYLPPPRINVLEDMLIRFTQASSLNDTLELRPPVKGVANDERLAELAGERQIPKLRDMISPKDTESLERICPGLLEQCLASLIPECVRQTKLKHEKNPHAVFDALDQLFGILSLAEISTDVRMWSHYADGGRGFLIEFDPKHSWFHAKREERDSFRHMRQVNYVSSRPDKYLLDVTDLDFLYTKWDVWCDEQEWRILRCFNDAAKKCTVHDPYGNDVLLFSIPPDSIKSVVLGFSASRDFETKVRSILETNAALDHVQVRRAFQSNETGKVEILPENLDAGCPIHRAASCAVGGFRSAEGRSGAAGATTELPSSTPPKNSTPPTPNPQLH